MKFTFPLNIKSIIEITIKDLKGFFDSMYGYILLFIFCLISYFIFLQSFFIIGSASLRQLFQMFPLYLIVFIPAITMGSFARESDKQTIEYILTKPVRTLEVILGKTLASIIFAFTAVLLTSPLYFTISKIGKTDAGETIAGYLGALLLITALSAMGVAISSFFKNQISAFLVTCFLIFILYIIGSPLASANVPVEIANMLATLDLNSYYANIIRGVMDLGDLLYFVLFTVISLVIAKVNIDRYRITNPKALIKNSVILVGGTVLFVFWLIYLSRNYEYRIDLTQSKKYTLSPISKSILKKDGKIKFEIYASTDLPQQYQANLDELRNQLKDYKLVAGNNLEIQYIDPKGKETELKDLGISPVQFNVIGNDQFQAKNGYLALVVKNESGDKKESIPYINDINNLEFQIIRLVNKVKASEPSKLAFASGNGEYTLFEDYSSLNQILSDNFTVESTYLPGDDLVKDKNAKDKAKDFKLDGYSALFIANPTAKYTKETLDSIKAFLNKGGKVIYAVDPLKIDLSQNASVGDYDQGKNPQLDLFADLGIKVNKDMVYDIKSKSTVTVQTSSGMPISIPYPLFPQLIKNSDVIPYVPQNIMAEWPSSLEITDANAWKIVYKTSDKAGLVTANYNLDPSQQFSQDGLKTYPVVAVREFDNGGKLIALSDARMFEDQYLKNSESNVLFALSVSEFISNNAGLAQIKAKNLFNSQFNDLDDKSKSIVRIGSPLATLVLLGLLGGYRITRRRLLNNILARELA